MPIKSVSNPIAYKPPEDRPIATGRVIDEHGLAVAAASIDVLSTSVPITDMARVTDSAGQFKIELPAGKIELEASTRDGRYGRVWLDGGSAINFEIIVRTQQKGR